MRALRTRPLSALLLAGLLATGLSACGDDPEPRPDAAASPSASPTATPAPKPSPTGLTRDPLTGTASVPQGPVVAVKLDNSPLARPFHRGLGQVSVMYQELMEGGATRFLAIYAPAPGAEVGPIRSVRDSDLDILRAYGKVPLVFSGGNAGTLATVAKAARAGTIIDAGFDVLPSLYRKAERRKDARNFFASPARANQLRPGGASVKDVGLRFGPLPAASAPAPRASVRFSPITRVQVQYEPTVGGGRYAVFQDGDRMRDYAPANVIVQSVKIAATRYRDVLGNPTPATVTVGSGAVTLLRDGRRLTGTWRRPAATQGTRFLDAAGRDLALKQGPTLVLLVPVGMSLQVG